MPETPYLVAAPADNKTLRGWYKDAKECGLKFFLFVHDMQLNKDVCIMPGDMNEHEARKDTESTPRAKILRVIHTDQPLERQLSDIN